MRSAAQAMTGTCPITWKKQSAESVPKWARMKSFSGLSGGVDSSVAAALIHRAIGKQLTCVFVDNGLLRLDEAKQVMDTLQQEPGRQKSSTSMPARVSLNNLQGVSDPETKRRIIGREFVEVFQREAAKIQMPAGWRRARFIRMLSNPPAVKQKKRIRSNRTIMSADCRIRCI